MKRLKHILLLIILCLTSVCAKGIEHENIFRIHFGGIWQQDQYLSPLLYDGLSAGIGNEWWQAFSRHENWSHVGKVYLTGGYMRNTKRSNAIHFYDIRGGWGTDYAWKWPNIGIQLLVGPYLNAEFQLKSINNNVNKPYSFDIAIDAMAQVGIAYVFKAAHSSYRLRYIIHANVIGIDFMPDYWQSYYELSEGVKGNIRCSGMWNHRTLQHELTLDMQLPHSTWRFGIEHQYIEYGATHLWFSKEHVCAIVGICWHYETKHNKAYVL